MLEQIIFNTNTSEAIDRDKNIEKNHGRIETREVFVYNDLYNIDTTKWIDLKQIIKIKRTTYVPKKDKTSFDESFYISSNNISAKEYNYGIRSHWSIENSLHYVKDVTFKEDASLIRTGNAPSNLSIIRNIAINTLRKTNYNSFPQAIRKIGGNISKLYELLA
jgi:predicted transposase YbfD/YdcC